MLKYEGYNLQKLYKNSSASIFWGFFKKIKSSFFKEFFLKTNSNSWQKYLNICFFCRIKVCHKICIYQL